MAEDLYHTIAEIIIEFKTLLHALFHLLPNDSLRKVGR